MSARSASSGRSRDALGRTRLRAYAASVRRAYEAALAELVEIPSVSSDPARAADVRRAARCAAARIRSLGGTARIVETGGHPLVIGELRGADGGPTVAFYNHLDVQPADEPGWRTDPFRFVKRRDRYLGRGTTDDKGPALAALWGAHYALSHGVRARVRFLWELEEEIGSPHLERCLRRHARALASDVIVVSDTIWISRARPACPVGLRGLQAFRLHLRTADHDTHSGTTGGAARNPVAELAALVSELHDARTGRVRIPGFYDEVVRPSRAELAELARAGFRLSTFRRDHGLRSLRTRRPIEVLRRIWLEPTLEVHGIAGGYAGPGVKTIVPAEATALVSCRLVPRMRPERIVRLLRAFVRERAPDVEVTAEHALEPYAAPVGGRELAALAAAVEHAFGRRPAFVREGGSIGAVPVLHRLLRAPVLFLGLSLPEHGYHAPNECFDWGQARGGMAAFAKLLELLAGR